ncbi:signal peptide-containing protein [Theileria equi strain WA]|uniref:Signal peptide-containing protein n=1 Tax=Theileria equi strain WA TaxID=1537102 RepID=L0AZG6_THEEQ|nr:signal peptide-containing protein [Theileria equi strain WA]AFZ80982.1 signal peptide-containing protein [Theileria equi strain WA]|eukprot:XP_004830648.1 signal peptide-containing protein [Theileria equi strain WA]
MIVFTLKLPILLAILASFKGAIAPPTTERNRNNKDKILIDLNISGSRTARIEVIPSMKFPCGTNYTVRRNARHTHIIGNVRDNDELIISGDPTAMSRYVLNVRGERGFRYVKVITRYRVACSYTTHIKEFWRESINDMYKDVQREPMTLNILEQTGDEYISARLIALENPQEEEDAESLSSPLHVPAVYDIRPQYRLHYFIGMVKYGEYTVDNQIQGLVERRVIWEGRLGDPKITVISLYKDGDETEAVYKFGFTEDQFKLLDYKRKFIELYE